MIMETQAYPRGRWSSPPKPFPVTRTSPDSAQTPGAMERSLDRAASCEAAVTGELLNDTEEDES